jgi:hypothetical protein
LPNKSPDAGLWFQAGVRWVVTAKHRSLKENIMKAKREDYSEAEANNQETSNNSDNESFEQALARRLARRNFLKGAAVSTGRLFPLPTSHRDSRKKFLRGESIELDHSDTLKRFKKQPDIAKRSNISATMPSAKCAGTRALAPSRDARMKLAGERR